MQEGRWPKSPPPASARMPLGEGLTVLCLLMFTLPSQAASHASLRRKPYFIDKETTPNRKSPPNLPEVTSPPGERRERQHWCSSCHGISPRSLGGHAARLLRCPTAHAAHASVSPKACSCLHPAPHSGAGCCCGRAGREGRQALLWLSGELRVPNRDQAGRVMAKLPQLLPFCRGQGWAG